jgi:hypothetical protein
LSPLLRLLLEELPRARFGGARMADFSTSATGSGADPFRAHPLAASPDRKSAESWGMPVTPDHDPNESTRLPPRPLLLAEFLLFSLAIPVVFNSPARQCHTHYAGFIQAPDYVGLALEFWRYCARSAAYSATRWAREIELGWLWRHESGSRAQGHQGPRE